MGFQEVLRSMRSVVSTRETVGGTLRQIRDEIAATQQKRNALVMAAPTRQDVEAMVAKRVADLGESFSAEFAAKLQRFVGDARALENPHLIATFVTLVGGEDATGTGLDGALCAAMPKQITAALIASLDRISWPDKPVPLADRHRQIAQLNQREAELQQQECELIQAIEEARIQLDENYK